VAADFSKYRDMAGNAWGLNDAGQDYANHLLATLKTAIKKLGNHKIDRIQLRSFGNCGIASRFLEVTADYLVTEKNLKCFNGVRLVFDICTCGSKNCWGSCYLVDGAGKKTKLHTSGKKGNIPLS